MAVGQHDAAHTLHILLNVAKIGDHQIHPQHVAVGERHAAVYDDDIALALDERDILSDLIQTSQKGYAHRRLFDGCDRLGSGSCGQLFGFAATVLIASGVL